MTGVGPRSPPRRDRKPAAVSDPNPRVSLELRSLLPYPNSCLGVSPHQQERDTKMAMLSFGGIDVSKDRLDVMILPEERCSSVPNDAAGWADLVERLSGSSIAVAQHLGRNLRFKGSPLCDRPRSNSCRHQCRSRHAPSEHPRPVLGQRTMELTS